MIFDQFENSWFSTLKMPFFYLSISRIAIKSVVSECFSFGDDLLYFSLTVVTPRFLLIFCLGNVFHIYLLNCMSILVFFPQIFIIFIISLPIPLFLLKIKMFWVLYFMHLFSLMIAMFYLLCQLFWDISPAPN